MQPKITLVFCAALAIVMLTQVGHSNANTTHCKELDNVACYSGSNEGRFCNSKDQTKAETRWFYDKGTCRKFAYKGCYGNRNRFCTKDSCERRCGGK